MFAQPELERALDTRVRALPSVEVHRAAEVVDIGPAPSEVALVVASPAGDRHEIGARWVVGCDGANSFVRRHLGSAVTDLGFFFDWLIVDVVPRERRGWTPTNRHLSDPGRPAAAGSGGPGRPRRGVIRLPGGSVAGVTNRAPARRRPAPPGMTPRHPAPHTP